MLTWFELVIRTYNNRRSLKFVFPPKSILISNRSMTKDEMQNTSSLHRSNSQYPALLTMSASPKPFLRALKLSSSRRAGQHRTDEIPEHQGKSIPWGQQRCYPGLRRELCLLRKLQKLKALLYLMAKMDTDAPEIDKRFGYDFVNHRIV